MTVLLEFLVFVLPLNNFVVLALQRTVTSVTYVAFSMVLYSRLHLVTRNLTLLRVVIYTIIVVGFLLKIPNIFNICVPTLYRRHSLFQTLYYLNIIPGVQEVVLSTMFIYLFFRYARAGSLEPRDKAASVFLISVQLVILISDVAMITLICVRYNLLRTMLVPFTFALKLRLEFLVLNRLTGSELSRQKIQGLALASVDTRSWYTTWLPWINYQSPKQLSSPERSISKLDAGGMICNGNTIELTVISSKHGASASASASPKAWTATHPLCGEESSTSDTNYTRHGSARPGTLDFEAVERLYLGRFEAEKMV
jgi:hypothetical protein